MVSETLNLWSNGAVTLPKEWRDRWPTKHFMAEETKEGYLIIKPIIMRDAIFYEDEEGFGLHYPMGIEAGKLSKCLWKAEREIHAESGKKKRVGRKGKGKNTKR